MHVSNNYQVKPFNPYFGIKVSKNFINNAHNHYNYQIVKNKKENVYKFNEKVKEYEGFGYDNYTLEYERRSNNGNWQHYLVAVKDGNEKQKINIISNRNTLVKIINRFLSMNEKEFKNNFVQKGIK
ncbi:MAG: hypothetical protein VZR09_01720 [Candidatus Gastranaerophilaceae bacterium]|nr:hypothetical protein [Candidatus Gastranaerophilaceae bacterium]